MSFQLEYLLTLLIYFLLNVSAMEPSCSCSELIRMADCASSKYEQICVWLENRCKPKSCYEAKTENACKTFPSIFNNNLASLKCYWNGYNCLSWSQCSDIIPKQSSALICINYNCITDGSRCKENTALTSLTNLFGSTQIKICEEIKDSWSCNGKQYGENLCYWNFGCKSVKKEADCSLFPQSLCSEFINSRCQWVSSKCMKLDCTKQSKYLCDITFLDTFCSVVNGKCVEAPNTTPCNERLYQNACQLSENCLWYQNKCVMKKCSELYCTAPIAYLDNVKQNTYKFCQPSGLQCIEGSANQLDAGLCSQSTNFTYSWDSKTCRKCTGQQLLSASYLITVAVLFLNLLII